ncbi:MAG: HAD-IA family hydrolase [Gammaproteobacteria bacterium]
MVKLKAIIFDVDGTLANTEEIHRQSFNEAFAEFGFKDTWSVEEYARLLAISGGKERITAWLRSRDPAGSGDMDVREFALRIHQRKSEIYRDHLRAGRIAPRPGVVRLMQEALRNGIRMGIATSTSRSNVETLLACILDQELRSGFDAIATSDIIADKKPSPSVYQFALAKLCISPAECIAIEDTTNGNRAACACGIATLITIHEFTLDNDFTGAKLVIDQLGEPGLPFRKISGNTYGKSYVDTDLLRHILAGHQLCGQRRDDFAVVAK